jgi:hypothetical protein
MAFRPAQIWTGSAWDDVGDKRISTTNAIPQTSVNGLSTSLAAKADYELPVNAQANTTYTFALADARRLTTATNAGAKTFTIPPQTSVAWANNSIIRVVNYGAGALTINGGSGVTVTNTATTLGQFQSAAAIRTGSNAWTLIPFAGGGVGEADFSNTATGTVTENGVTYKYVRFTASGTLTVTEAGRAEVLTVSGGGGGGGVQASSGATFRGAGGGGAGGALLLEVFLNTGTYSLTVGGGGAGGGGFATGGNGTASRFDPLMPPLAGGGGGGASGGSVNSPGQAGGSGGGGGYGAGVGLSARGLGTTNLGNNGAQGNGGGGGGKTAAASGGTAGAGIVFSTFSVAGGGGGGAGSDLGAAGLGANGGGNGGKSGNGSAGTANTGGGGGGAGGAGGGGQGGGAGGSGVVIVRVRT